METIQERLTRIPDITVAEFFSKHYVNCVIPQEYVRGAGLWDEPLTDAVEALAKGVGYWYWAVDLVDAVLPEAERRELACIILRLIDRSWYTESQLRLIEMVEQGRHGKAIDALVRGTLSENAAERSMQRLQRVADPIG